MSMAWNSDSVFSSAMFDPLRASLTALQCEHWPDFKRLNACIEGESRAIVTGSGATLRFVPQSIERARDWQEGYEPRAYLRGEVQVREQNWHDLFNALGWMSYPHAKAALNHRHYLELQKQHDSATENRGAAQDALTLFDEGGVIVASADAELSAMLIEHRWKELFWQYRAALQQRMRFYLFGHALYEKALRPYIGITGSAMILDVAPAFMSDGLGQQLRYIDKCAAQCLQIGVNAAQDLAPLPILGVPGWCADNQQESYYDNLSYFRPRPLKRSGTKNQTSQI